MTDIIEQKQLLGEVADNGKTCHDIEFRGGVEASEMSAQGTQFGRLPVDDAEILLLRQIEIAALFDLRKFPFAHHIRRPTDHAAGVSRTQAGGEMK